MTARDPRADPRPGDTKAYFRGTFQSYAWKEGMDPDLWADDAGGTARWAAPAPTREGTLALRDAFVAAGRELFDALDAFALAAGGVPYDRDDVKVDLDGPCAGMVENAGGDVLGPGDAPALAVGYETYPYDAWATPEALAGVVAAKVQAALAHAASCRAASEREVVASARRTLEAAGYVVAPREVQWDERPWVPPAR